MAQLPLQWFKAMIAMELRNVKYKISSYHLINQLQKGFRKV